MAKGWLGAGLLTACLLLGLVLSVVADRACLPAESLLEQAAQSSTEGDLEEGIRLAQKAQSQWKTQWNTIAAMADHEPMDEVDALFAQLETYANTGETPHFIACCKELARRIRAFADIHRFTWWNVL